LKKRREILLGVTGSIAAYKAGDIVRRLMEHDCSVTVVMTESAKKFVTPLTFAALSGNKVYCEMFGVDPHSWEKEHVSLSESAELFLIAPSTANVIGKIANGIADDLLTCIAMTTRAQILMAPAMNTQMFQNKILQENIAKLKKSGVRFIDPIEGKLACETTGQGHLADVDTIVKAALRSLK